MTVDSKIKARIAALFAKAEGTDNQHERNAFMAKAIELLEQHQLERWEVDSANDPLGATLGTIVLPGGGHWKRILAGQVAQLFYAIIIVRVSRNRSSACRYEIVGRESCRITTHLMLPYIFNCVKKEAQQLLETTYDETLNKDRAERMVGNALAARIADIIRARKFKRQVGAATGASLVLVDELEAYVAKNYLLNSSRKTSVHVNNQAKERAGNISLSHQATNSAAKQLR